MKLDSSLSPVVTGGASGLGAATARQLAAHGVKVAIFDLNADLGEALAKEIGGVYCAVNVTSSADVDAAFAKARAAIGQERILVNCAGVGGSVTITAGAAGTGGNVVGGNVNLVPGLAVGTGANGAVTIAPSVAVSANGVTSGSIPRSSTGQSFTSR